MDNWTASYANINIFRIYSSKIIFSSFRVQNNLYPKFSFFTTRSSRRKKHEMCLNQETLISNYYSKLKEQKSN